jgi:hypothetical protein
MLASSAGIERVALAHHLVLRVNVVRTLHYRKEVTRLGFGGPKDEMATE